MKISETEYIQRMQEAYDRGCEAGIKATIVALRPELKARPRAIRFWLRAVKRKMRK